MLFLVHALYTSGSPLMEDQLASKAAAESCDDINDCRKLFDIIWGCLATIFACTWVSVHPNVPPPNQARLALFWRRLRMMLVAVIAPELMCSLKIDFKISQTHGFFICMGGFVSRARNHPVVIQEQFVTIPEYLTDIRAVEEEDIKDKSKGDTLSKGVALMQGFWFTAQCLARLHQHLPVSELEVMTLAFAVVNIFIYALWWGKPLDVQRPMLVGPQPEVFLVEPSREVLKSSLLRSESINGGKFVEIDSKPWQGGFIVRLWAALHGGYGAAYNPKLYTSVPSFWSTASNDTRDKSSHTFYIECLVGVIFGGIHCAAWNTSFLSAQEMWIWRLSALAVAAVPGIVAGIRMVKWSYLVDDDSAVDTIFKYTFYLSFTVYPITRFFLIVLPLVSLRVLPPGALTDVDWNICAENIFPVVIQTVGTKSQAQISGGTTIHFGPIIQLQDSCGRASKLTAVHLWRYKTRGEKSNIEA
ncbi:hypothetical protein C8R43DRAFT_1190751 [Mycena crocata]|nr:hypothetical protein C8R43DRAFT_1190751 [Mycena crocata]